MNILRYAELKALGCVALRRITKQPLMIVADVKRYDPESGVATVVTEKVDRTEIVAARTAIQQSKAAFDVFITDFDVLRDAP